MCGLVGIPDLAKTRCGYSERLLCRFVTETLRVVLNVTPETRWPALNVTPETRRGFSPARRFDGLGSPRLAPWHGAPVTRRRSGATNLASDVDKRTMRINAMARRGRINHAGRPTLVLPGVNHHPCLRCCVHASHATPATRDNRRPFFKNFHHLSL